MAEHVDREPESQPPRVWLVVGEKPGDNAQIRNLAEAIGWPCEEKRIFVQPRWVEGKPRVRATLDHIDRARSDSLEAPWPDLVITAGRRLSCVGFWIKRASGGRTRMVMIGKPRRLHGLVDLIVVAGHYVMPPAANVVRHDLPFMQIDTEALEQAGAHWRPRLADLPRPLTALMVGGPTGGLRFDLDVARDLLARAKQSALAHGGSLYVTTSRRTPATVVEMLRGEVSDSVRVYAFDGQAPPGENPYHGLLALADRFVATTDSASMMVEVARLGRPLALYPLEARTGRLERALVEAGVLRRLSPRRDPIPAGGLRARLQYRLGRPGHSRDLSAIPRLLVEKGLACWLGDEWPETTGWVDDELEAVASRVRALFDAPPGARV